MGGPDARCRRARSQQPDSRHRRYGALESADGEFVRGGAGAPVAGAKRGAGIAAHLDRAPPVRVGILDRTTGAIGGAGAGRCPGVDQQHHRQPALPGFDGLARLRRNDEHRRAEAARGSGRPVRRHGLCDTRSLPARGRRDCQAKSFVRVRRGTQGDPARVRERRRRGRQEWRRRSGCTCRLLPDRQGTTAPRAGGHDAGVLRIDPPTRRASRPVVVLRGRRSVRSRWY